MKRYYIVLLLLHAALAALASHLPMPTDNIFGNFDYSTEYTYDRNANITTLKRMGIIDKVGLRNEYGLHSHYTMQYSRNQLTRLVIEKEGEDYEGRTGLAVTGSLTGFMYDNNGNLTADPSRGIFRMDYDRHNLPVDVHFSNGHRQTVTYDGFEKKRQVIYRQLPEAFLNFEAFPYEDSKYQLLNRRDYIGPHVFANDSLEYSAFPGGYFTPEGTFYYITDWRKNNTAVFRANGKLEQQTRFYPYGEPTREPAGQRYLFLGKEREHAGGRNCHDLGARCLTPIGSFGGQDKFAEKFYPLSPYIYCGADPINRVDPDGNWNIKVSASPDRGRNPYAILSVYDRNWKTVYKTVVKVRGNKRDRSKTYGDTPQGRYKLLEWRETDNKRYPKELYGPLYLLATHYEYGEGFGRDDMHIHGVWPEGSELKGTNGCVRISNEDIIDLRIITGILEQNDSEERMEYMEVTNDLEDPVRYSDRDKIKDELQLCVTLPELIVTLNRN